MVPHCIKGCRANPEPYRTQKSGEEHDETGYKTQKSSATGQKRSDDRQGTNQRKGRNDGKRDRTREGAKRWNTNRGKEKMQIPKGLRAVVPRPRLLSPYPQGDRDQGHHLGRGQEGHSQSLRNHCLQGKLAVHANIVVSIRWIYHDL